MILLFWLACGSVTADEVALEVVAANPLGTIERDIDRTPFDGEVREVREAGGYGYHLVDDRWTVSLGDSFEPGDQVTAKPVGRALDFHSKRTGHRYEELWFVTLKSKP